MREFIDGAEAIVRGALAAGCNFFAGYPITPASSILIHMLRELPKIGGVGIQAEDEIAAIGFCIGAASAGARAMTATSGPGISLYSENIGLAIMAELPLVIVDAQRLGPATGGATTVAQGDVQFLRWGTSGGYPIIALCPTTVAECYHLTIKAFALAERFRCPVFLATDKEVVTTMATVEIESYGPPVVPAARPLTTTLPPGQPYIPYQVNALEDVPAFSPFGGEALARITTSTHDERGYLTKDPAKVARLNQHLSAKIEAHRAELEMVHWDRQEGAKTLLISYGITARTMIEAVHQARAEGKKVSALTLYSLWPAPKTALVEAIQGMERVVVAELNLGQYRETIEHVCWQVKLHPDVIGVNRVDGELIRPDQLLVEICR